MFPDINSLPQLESNISLPGFNSNNLSIIDPDINLPSSTNFKYYTTQDFLDSNQIQACVNSKSFSVLHCNIRSLAANYDKLSHMLDELKHSFSIIGLTETKHKLDREQMYQNNLPEYDFISQPSHTNAGGTGFYVKTNLSYSLRSDLSCSSVEFESIWIEVDSNLHHNIICGVVYRHPNSDLEAFMVFLNQVLDKISQENKFCVIMGDFNLNLLNYETHGGTDEFLNTMGSYFYHPEILQPTRITEHSATLIDNIFFNSINHHTISGNIIHDLTDHLPNFLIINNFSTLPKNFKLFRRDYSNFDEVTFLNEIQSINWEFETSIDDDPDSMFDVFYSKLSSVVDRHIPLKQLSKAHLKNLDKPWISRGIRKSIKLKNNYYKKYIKTRSIYHYNKFKTYRNKINHLLRISKVNYYNKYFTKNR